VRPQVHTWGLLNGTSMSTPMTAGVAALVASALGSYDGNYFKGLQVGGSLTDAGAACFC
jgi:hypothetical protein